MNTPKTLDATKFSDTSGINTDFGGVTVDDLGRIVQTGDYLTAENVMAGYNTGFDLTGTAFDRIDKITSRSERAGADVSREGVQRDLLPLIEGTAVSTKHGVVKTDYILFIASGAFHLSKPSDMLPELQGRLPIRVELESLSKDDFKLILTETQNSLIKQYVGLLGTEKVDLEFDEGGIESIASLATEINQNVENIGARRLHTIMEKLLEEVSFNASDIGPTNINIDRKFVETNLVDLIKSQDLSKFIL